MKKVVILLLTLCSFLFATNDKDADKTREQRVEEQIQKALEEEEKFAKEQTFYKADEYDFEAAEVNEDSLSSIPALEDDFEFNMDNILQ
ncbi:MAG: hypothetical protein GX780_04805 [Campylobacteraceae bacterium]|nr:hypothetical protein [Campylobacteraceae bacterium]